jgi:hypothetical protein
MTDLLQPKCADTWMISEGVCEKCGVHWSKPCGNEAARSAQDGFREKSRDLALPLLAALEEWLARYADITDEMAASKIDSPSSDVSGLCQRLVRSRAIVRQVRGENE